MGGSRSLFAIFVFTSLMIIDNFDAFRRAFAPDEADSPLIVDPDTVLPQSVADQGLEMVSGNRCEVGQRSRSVHMIQLPLCHVLKTSVLSRLFSMKQLGRVLRPKRADHFSIICRLTLNGKR